MGAPQPVDPEWLTARTEADSRARGITEQTLLPRLAEHLRKSAPPDSTMVMVDLGAGSGANQRWLAPRLPFPQRWVHVDHDPVILAHGDEDGTEHVVAGVEELPAFLGRTPYGCRVVTCAAVLDVLPATQVEQLCDTLVRTRTPALLSLTVTGSMTLDPPHPDDAALLDAFNDHQRRDGLAGPDAADLAVRALRDAGFEVWTEETPWLLNSASDRTFTARFLRERVTFAVERDAALSDTGAEWLGARQAELSAGRLRIDLGHRDLLTLPQRSWRTADLTC